jgi:hypothetical protein
MVDPSVGGGTARYMHSTPDGAMVDIKGVARELRPDEFGLPERDYEDGYQKGNDWFHMSVNPDTPGTSNERPEFRAGDMVKIADVYGSIIGPGMGVFVAYGTTGQDAIISFDNKEIVVPVANIGAVLEQNAKDNFDEMDNDGNLSPMSFGSENIKVEEPEMDQRDEFSKWMSAVEEALQNEGEPMQNAKPTKHCGCGAWDCPVCFPDEMMAEEEETFVNKPRGGKGVKLGDIIQRTEVRPTDGHDSPLTYGEDNLDEQIPTASAGPDYFQANRDMQEPTSSTSEIEEEPNYDDDYSDLGHYEPSEHNMADYHDLMIKSLASDRDIEQGQEMASKILNIQDMGLSKDNKHYTEEELLGMNMGLEDIKKIYDRVMGDVSESDNAVMDVSPTRSYSGSDEMRELMNRLNGTPDNGILDTIGDALSSIGNAIKGSTQAQTTEPQQAMPNLCESCLKPTLFEQIKWDEELEEAFIEESSLSKLIGKQKGGQNLVRWMHRRHGLSNDADLEPAKFSERLLWKQFKANPDNFVIVAAQHGVAGIKPDKKFIDNRTKEFAKKGKQYNPSGDSTLPYQIVAFTDDGQQVDPSLLRAPPEDGEDYSDPRDPTVMRARMGKHSGKDTQNPHNVFNLLSEQIGSLITVYISGFENVAGGEQRGSVERDKMAKRADLKKGPSMDPTSAIQRISQRLQPVIKTLVDQAIQQINRKAQQYLSDGDFESAQKVSSSGQKLKNMSPDGSIDQNTISDAIAQASQSQIGSDEFNDYATTVAKGNSAAMRPVLDALRNNLLNM